MKGKWNLCEIERQYVANSLCAYDYTSELIGPVVIIWEKSDMSTFFFFLSDHKIDFFLCFSWAFDNECINTFRL